MNFNALFYPESIAIIGASTKLKSVGNDVVKNLTQQGYGGKLYLVNPKASELYGQTVYPDIAAIPGNVDLAIIAIPAAFVPESIEQLAAKQTKAAIVISAGFKETGNHELEDKLAKACNDHNITLIGPNCLGVINADHHMNASFAGIMPAVGNVAFLSQSGALCATVLDYAREFKVGFSKFMSIGNKAVVDEATLLEYFAADPQTKVIAMYAEQLDNAPRFIAAAKKVTQGSNPKPIIILKSGRTSAGAKAIASHTGSLSGGDAAYEALFAQSGVIRANTIRELIEFVTVFSQNEYKPVNNVTIITNAGGPGVLATDAAVNANLNLSEPSESIKESLKAFLPPAASFKNPIDVLGDAPASRYQQTLNVLATDSQTDAVMLILTPQSMTEPDETAAAVIEFRKKCDKPLVASFMGAQTVAKAVQTLSDAGISTTTFPEIAAKGLGNLSRFEKWSKLPAETAISPIAVDRAKVDSLLQLPPGQNHLPEDQALQVLEAYGFPTLKRQEVRSAEAAATAASSFTSTVALKIISPDILHKSDAGGVMLNVEPTNIPTAYQQLLDRVHTNVPTAKLEGVLCVEMAPKDGIEMIVGANQNSLGTLLMVGLGGVYVEVFKDVNLGYAPLTNEYAKQMVMTLKSHPILQGVRGHGGYDTKALIDTLGRLSQLVTDYPQIKEIDVNPILILPDGQGARVLDTRIML